MPNVYDQFDSPAPPSSAVPQANAAMPVGGNPYDQFDLPNRPMIHEKPSVAQDTGLFGRMGAAAASMLNTLLGGFQSTSPITHTMQGQPNYQKLGSLTEADSGPVIVDQKGNFVPFDSAKHVVFIDPATHQPTVYARSEEMATSPLTAAGHVLSLGMLAPTPVRPAAQAAASAQRLQDFEGSGITPNIPAVTQSRTAGILANTFKDTPVVGAPISKGIQKNIGEAAQSATNVAAKYGTAATPEEGGQALQEGAAAFKGSKPEMPVPLATARSTPTRNIGFIPKSEALYNAIPIDGNAPVKLTSTLDALEGVSNKFPSNPEFGATLQNSTFGKWLDLLKNGQLSWDETNTFRQFVGKQMRQPSGELGLGPDDWRRLYGALTKDQETTAAEAGPEALKAFQQARDYYSAGLKRLNDTLSFISSADSPEKAYYGLTKMAAQRGRSADIGRLQSTLRSLPQEYRDDVAATVLRRLGLPTKSQAGANAEDFSLGTWASNYADISPKAKEALFGPTGTGPRDALEALSRSINSLKNVERLGNTSGTARETITAAAGFGLATRPFETAIALAGNLLGAKALMSPTLTRWLVRMKMATTPGAMSAQLAKLKTMADAEPAYLPFYRAILAQQPANESSPPQGMRPAQAQ